MPLDTTPLFGLGLSGKVGMPLANEMAKLVAATAMTVITIALTRLATDSIGFSNGGEFKMLS
jgi:hypothetical protein